MGNETTGSAAQTPQATLSFILYLSPHPNTFTPRKPSGSTLQSTRALSLAVTVLVRATPCSGLDLTMSRPGLSPPSPHVSGTVLGLQPSWEQPGCRQWEQEKLGRIIPLEWFISAITEGENKAGPPQTMALFGF